RAGFVCARAGKRTPGLADDLRNAEAAVARGQQPVGVEDGRWIQRRPAEVVAHAADRYACRDVGRRQAGVGLADTEAGGRGERRGDVGRDDGAGRVRAYTGAGHDPAALVLADDEVLVVRAALDVGGNPVQR